MPRVKRGVPAHRRHKKLLKQAKGFRGKRKNIFKLAQNAVNKAGQNAYIGRKRKKRDFHQLWILRINAGCRQNGMQYSRFIYGLELAGVRLNRKMLSELASNHEEVFAMLVKEAKAALPPVGQAPDLEELKQRFAKAAAEAPKKTKEGQAEKPKAEKKPKAEGEAVKKAKKKMEEVK